LKTFLLPLFCLFALNISAGPLIEPDSLVQDSVHHDTVRMYKRPKAFLVPVVLVGYGLSSFVIHPIRNIDYWARAEVAATAPNYNSKVADYMQIAPAAAVYALNLVGVEGKNRFVDRTALLALSAGILSVADGSKFLAKRTRPYGTDPLSFPSGHTGAAFLCAEYFVQEYGDKSVWYSVAAYTCATATGVLRVYGRAHWVSDCVAGAGLGMLSTKAAYLLYPHVKNWLSHKTKYGLSTTVMPNYEYGVPGLTFAAQM